MGTDGCAPCWASRAQPNLHAGALHGRHRLGCASRQAAGEGAALQRIERVAATGTVAEADLQRASELALATLDGCQSLGFRQRLLAAYEFQV